MLCTHTTCRQVHFKLYNFMFLLSIASTSLIMLYSCDTGWIKRSLQKLKSSKES